MELYQLCIFFLFTTGLFYDENDAFILPTIRPSSNLTKLKSLSSSSSLLIIERLYDLFQGTFDNKEQAIEALHKGCPRADLGGHERVTCLIEPHPHLKPYWLIAIYYLDEDVSKTFRFRYYEIIHSDDENENYCAKMRIYRCLPNTNQILKDSNYNINKFLPNLDNEMQYVKECDIGWKQLNENKNKDNNVDGYASSNSFQGELIGSGILQSERDPTKQIIVKDELILKKDVLSINDRVYDGESGKQLIGNINGIPYMMRRQL